MSRVRAFTDKDPELNRKLVQLEDSIYALLALVPDGKLELTEPVLKSGFLARLGRLVPVLKPVEVLLPVPRIDDSGGSLVIWNRSGGTVTVRPVGGSINGAATASLSGARAYRIHTDGANYAGEF